MTAFRHVAREIDRSQLVDHTKHHPNGSVPHCDWGQGQTLHAAVMYSNPCRWRTRLRLFNDCIRHLRSLPNLKLYVGEVAFGDRPFEVTARDNPLDFQFRTRDVLWHKENALNQVIERFDPDWEYGCYIDGDVTFTRTDIALETIHQLQKHDWVQMFSTYCDLGPNHLPMRITKSFGFQFMNGELDDLLEQLHTPEEYNYSGNTSRPVSATGLCWAFRRESFEACGRLLDTCILGSGDWHMAFGLAGKPDYHPNVNEMNNVNTQYADSIKIWQRRAQRAVKQNIGYVASHVMHHYHGSKHRRGYGERWKILRDHNFDPRRDVFRDSYGLFQLTPDKPKFRDDIRRYFNSRTEDSTTMYPGDSFIVGEVKPGT